MMNLEQLLGLVRHILTILGTYLVVTNKIEESAWTVITGSAMSIVGIIWSFTSKSKKS